MNDSLTREPRQTFKTMTLALCAVYVLFLGGVFVIHALLH